MGRTPPRHREARRLRSGRRPVPRRPRGRPLLDERRSTVSLPWIKVFTNLPRHWKADRLGELLDDPRAWTYVVELWLWAADVRPDGDLSSLGNTTIARRAGWQGDAEKF